MMQISYLSYYLPHTTSRFYLINFQSYTEFPPQFCIFTVKLPSFTQRSVSQKNAIFAYFELLVWFPDDENLYQLTFKWPRYFYSRWCPRGVPRDPSVENHFPTGILQWNLHHIFMGYKNSQFCKKKIENVVPFQNGGQINDFYFASFRFWPKFEKSLSQRNFSMKFGSK